MSTKLFVDHQRDIERIQQELQLALVNRERVQRGKVSGTLSHSTRSIPPAGRRVSTGRLSSVLGLDGEYLWAEPGVSMEQLLHWTLSRGLMPAVLPEFRGITVGGSVMGAALESSSFRYGQFSDQCDAYDLLLADGTKVHVSAQQQPELFYGVSGSYGTLASLTAAKLRVVPAKPMVRIEYHWLKGHDGLAEALDGLCVGGSYPDFVDGIVLDDDQAVLMTGHMINKSDVPRRGHVGHLMEPWRPWFIQHVLDRSRAPSITQDYFPLIDYLFRYDRGAFWMGRYCTSLHAMARFLFGPKPLKAVGLSADLPDIFAKGSLTLRPSQLFRLAFGWKLSSRSMYTKLHQLAPQVRAQTFHIQDFYIPTKGLREFLRHLRQSVKIYPLWLCPVRGTNTEQFLSPHYLKGASRYPKPDFINVGVYGIPANGRTVAETCRELETVVHQLGGRKMLYALNSIPSEEFWQVYDKQRYEALRQSVGAEETVEDLYEKTH